MHALCPPGSTMEPSFLLSFSLLLALSTPCRACECKLQHPQTYYCTSDFGKSRETPEKSPPRRSHRGEMEGVGVGEGCSVDLNNVSRRLRVENLKSMNLWAPDLFLPPPSHTSGSIRTRKQHPAKTSFQSQRH